MDYDLQFKVITVGDSGTGKTQYCTTSVEQNTRKFSMAPTIGVEFFSRILDVDERKIRIQIWDTAGQERFQAITRSYYRGIVGGMIFFDLTRRISFKNVGYWLDEIEKNQTTKMSLILVGTFFDKPQYREVQYQEAADFALDNGLEYIEISAIEANQYPLKILCRNILKRLEDGDLTPANAEGVSLGEKIKQEIGEGNEGCCRMM